MDKWRTSPQNGSAASLVWLISFGDLLTLLVCFFLVLTPWHAMRRRGETRNPVIPATSTSRGASGTSLANPTVGPKPGLIIEVPIERGQFADPKKSAVFAKAMEEALANPETHTSSVLVRGCGSGTRDETIRMVSSLIRAHTRPMQRVSIELVSECESFEVVHPTSAAVVGSIRIVRE